MKNMKKALTFMLVLAMVFSLMATSVFATGGTTTGNTSTGNTSTGNTSTGGTSTGNTSTGGKTTGGKTTGGNGGTAVTTPDKTPAVPFTDVEEKDWYYDALKWAVEKGITNGVTATTFEPNSGCTRAQMVTFLWRIAGQPAPTNTTHNFGDVEDGAYYQNALLWAVEKGITNGITATTFEPDTICTRAQMVTFLNRCVGTTAADAEHPFNDVADGAYYDNAVAWAFEKNITKGMTATEFAPDEGCTRAQMVTFMYRCFAE